MQAVSRGACASLWATMAKIYIQAESGQIEGLETTVGGSSAGDNISIQGLKIVEAVRKSGQQSHGCPGGGNAQRSIFSMDESAAAETLLATQTIKTNCPFCHEKVTAEITKGTITCKTCDACVEVCGGKVRRKSNKKYLAKRTFRKNFKLFGEKSKSAKEAMNVKKQKAGNWLSGLLFGQ
jgi:ribosomal protein L37AE/L43A